MGEKNPHRSKSAIRHELDRAVISHLYFEGGEGTACATVKRCQAYSSFTHLPAARSPVTSARRLQQWVEPAYFQCFRVFCNERFGEVKNLQSSLSSHHVILCGFPVGESHAITRSSILATIESMSRLHHVDDDRPCIHAKQHRIC